MAPSVPPLSGLHHVTLTVRDLASSVGWYSDVLGFELVREIPDAEGRGEKRILLHPTARLMLVLTAHRSGDDSRFDEFRTGLDHIAFAAPDRAHLDEWARHLDAAGVAHSPVAVAAAGHVLTFRDPDNIQLEVYAS